MTPSIARKVIAMVQNENKTPLSEIFSLTPREKEVLNCLKKGMSYKMIAGYLGISFETVRTHMKKIYEKLHVRSVQEAMAKAFNTKLL
jgi:DNA-binding NarL/FixJ family response regulator